MNQPTHIPLTADERRERALQDVKLFIANDWELIEETPEFFFLRRNTATFGKHMLLLLFTWWTFGIANLFYYLISRKEKKILK